MCIMVVCWNGYFGIFGFLCIVGVNMNVCDN